jgi:leucyl aminopeptidase
LPAGPRIRLQKEIALVTESLIDRAGGKAVGIAPVTAANLKTWLKKQPAAIRRWVEDHRFKAEPATHLKLPARAGGLGGVLLGVEAGTDIWSYGALPMAVPEGRYRIDATLSPEAASAAALGWALGSYRFTRYKKPKRAAAKLVWPAGADRAHVGRMARSTFWIRDLINTPADDMGPAELAAEAERLAKEFRASFKVIVGDQLLKQNFPMIHAVGRASSRPPRLVDIRWGGSGPKIALVGKGVCFDSGGLDLKPASGMLQMKKDMGGAANVLGLARAVMAAKLPVQLRVLVPAVENAVSGNAYHPLDIVKTRKGITVEVGNTDAEGRLILCDALAEADRDDPALIVDCATLTGAARVALGTELPALFSNDDATAEALLRHGREQQDLFWRLPLHKPYRKLLDSPIADINNVSHSGHAGAITAALFLAEFVRPRTPWVHLDMMGANATSRPGRPEGGEAFGIRALFAYVSELAARG